MATNKEDRRCPICNDNHLTAPARARQEQDAYLYQCQRCGRFEIDGILVASGIYEGIDEARHLASAWVRRQNNAGITPFIGDGPTGNAHEWIVRLKRMGFPMSITQKLDALLLVLAERTQDQLHMPIIIQDASLISAVAARNQEEVGGLVRLLHELMYVDNSQSGGEKAKITGSGWLRVDELDRVGATDDTAFIAMWFDSCTAAYREAAEVAVSHCGYRPIIVDQEEFNGFIMDQVISSIKRSRFVVADFTCRPENEDVAADRVKAGVRGGVYWEAGMAYGLGKPVIHTCERVTDATRRRHFNVDQYNTIFWESDALVPAIRDITRPIETPSFGESLALRILATVGRGTYTEDE